jgi:signal transduction histidine kinase
LLFEKYNQLKAKLKDEAKSKEISEEVMAKIQAVEETEQEIDVEFIQEDLDALIGDSYEGTERIKKIVNDLKEFAHPGEEEWKDTDINSGIESTLNVVKNEIKYKAEVIKKLGELPIITANPQQLNQVFMNILVNAAQAINGEGRIIIETGVIEKFIEIKFHDNGCGISQENIKKIFDPFFTTKDVGAGTGLGMNIAYNIIEKHNGEISVESEVGKGTTFMIKLPVPNSSQG